MVNQVQKEEPKEKEVKPRKEEEVKLRKVNLREVKNINILYNANQRYRITRTQV